MIELDMYLLEKRRLRKADKDGGGGACNYDITRASVVVCLRSHTRRKLIPFWTLPQSHHITPPPIYIYLILLCVYSFLPFFLFLFFLFSNLNLFEFKEFNFEIMRSAALGCGEGKERERKIFHSTDLALYFIFKKTYRLRDIYIRIILINKHFFSFY